MTRLAARLASRTSAMRRNKIVGNPILASATQGTLSSSHSQRKFLCYILVTACILSWKKYSVSAFTPILKNVHGPTSNPPCSNNHYCVRHLPNDRNHAALKASLLESGSRILHPAQILHPSYFSHANKKQQEREINGSNEKSQRVQSIMEDDIANTPMPLYRAIDTMMKALSSITNVGIHSKNALAQIELLLHGALFKVDESIPSESTHKYTIRIEQSISHTVDPLCWLHANMPPWKSYPNSFYSSIPSLYLGNVESTLESAVFGAAATIRDLSTSGESWEWIKNLPEGSRFYGGGRFDQNIPEENVGDDWKEFEKGIWILPGIELRREKDGHSSQNDDFAETENLSGYDKDRIETKESKTTLSVHLHFSSSEQLIAAAENVIRLLQEVTHNTSPPVPPTTLPPIISRGYNKDAQEVFEKGVGTLLDVYNSNEGDQRSSHKTGFRNLKKVVMARRSDLYYAENLSGLDVMLKLKFGGDVGGHLFYLNPGAGKGKEFFGCTPERLFSIESRTGIVKSEALAGTRPRGSTSQEDEELLRDLMCSEKDRSENEITREFIVNAFNRLRREKFLVASKNEEKEIEGGRYFVRRLRHLQHLCQSLEEIIRDRKQIVGRSSKLSFSTVKLDY